MACGSVLIKNIDMVMTMNHRREILKNTSILIEDGMITCIGKDADHTAGEVKTLDGSGKAALPGFINAHAHGLSILGRGGLAPDRRLRDWLSNLTHPVYAGCSIDEAVPALEAFACECIKNGITTVVEMEGYLNDDYTGIVIDTLVNCGLRLFYAPIVQDVAAPLEIKRLEELFMKGSTSGQRGGHHHHDLYQSQEILDMMRKLICKYHHSYHDLVRICPAASNINEVSGTLLRGLHQLARENDTFITIHAAESALLESEKYGLSAIDYLTRLDCLNERMLLAHCVQVSDRDIRLIKATGAKIVHNPAANAFLGSGIAPVDKFILAGIPLGIGLDNPNCNDGVNMLADLRLAILIQKGVNRDPGCITAEKALEMATIDGAGVLCCQDKTGSLEVGKAADIILIDINYLHLQPIYHLPSVLVYQSKGNEIDTVIVDGRVLLENKKLINIDEEKVIKNLAIASKNVIDKMNLSYLTERGWQTKSVY